MNFPVNYISASLFLAVAVAIGNSRVLRVRGSWKARPILYMALVGKPGALKSHPMNFALNPLRSYDVHTLEEYAKELAEFRKTQIGVKPKARQIVVKDATMEALSKVLQINSHGVCLHCDELGGWTARFNRYSKSGGDQEQWLSLFNGDPIVVNRKTQDEVITVPNPFVCVLGSLQPVVLSKIFKGEKVDNGFIYRILFVLNPSEDEPVLWREEDLPSNATELWKSFLLNTYYSSKQIEDEETVVEYSFDDQAYSMMIGWHNAKEIEYNESGEDYLVAIFRKMQDYAMRFCLIIQTMREISGELSSRRVVDGVTVAKAVALTEYFIQNAINIYESVHFPKTEELSKIMSVLDSLPLTFSREQAVAVGEQFGLSRRTIFRHISGDSDDIFVEKIAHGKFKKR
jgi:hypothetical protein